MFPWHHHNAVCEIVATVTLLHTWGCD